MLQPLLCPPACLSHSLTPYITPTAQQRLVRVAERNGVTVILVHHTNKASQMGGANPNAAMLSGSGALSNVPKNVLLAYPMKGARATDADPCWKVVSSSEQ